MLNLVLKLARAHWIPPVGAIMRSLLLKVAYIAACKLQPSPAPYGYSSFKWPPCNSDHGANTPGSRLGLLSLKAKCAALKIARAGRCNVQKTVPDLHGRQPATLWRVSSKADVAVSHSTRQVSFPATSSAWT